MTTTRLEDEKEPFGEKGRRFVEAYRLRFRNRMIKALGGYDPVSVAYLMHKANLLAGAVELMKEKDPKLAYVVNAQIKGVKQATLALDPLYAIIRGYHREKPADRG